MTEEIFRAHDQNRQQLRAILDSQVFRDAVDAYRTNRNAIEEGLETVALNSAELVSVRLQSQRVGMEAFLRWLDQATNAIPETKPEMDASYGADAQADKLRQLGIQL